jgi:hypothetical protein
VRAWAPPPPPPITARRQVVCVPPVTFVFYAVRVASKESRKLVLLELIVKF